LSPHSAARIARDTFFLVLAFRMQQAQPVLQFIRLAVRLELVDAEFSS